MTDTFNHINLSNYEDYFMLFVDEELTLAQKEDVTQFLISHPHLESELHALQESKLIPDEEIRFELKSKMLKPELWDEENLTDLQIQLLEKLDDTNAAELEHVAINSSNIDDWNRLKILKLSIETIQHQHKHQLIHLEEWDAENLTAQQLAWLDMADSNRSPQFSDDDLVAKKEWEILQETYFGAHELLQMPNKEKLLQIPKKRKIALFSLPLSRFIAAAAAILLLLWLGWGKLIPSKEHSWTFTETDTGKVPEIIEQPKIPLPEKTVKVLDVKNPTGKKYGVVAIAKIISKNPNTQSIATVNPADPNQTGSATYAESKFYTSYPEIEQPEFFESSAKLSMETRKAISQNAKIAIDQPTLILAANSMPIIKRMPWQETEELESLDGEDYVSIAGAKFDKQKLRSVFRPITRTISKTIGQVAENSLIGKQNEIR